MKSIINQLKENLKIIRLKTLISSISIVIILFSISVFLSKNGLNDVWHIFYEHAWLEIFSGLLIYILVELKFDKYGKIPIADGERNYEEILLGISNSKRTVRILDNDFSSFFNTKVAVESNEVNMDNLLEREYNLFNCLNNCLNNLDNSQKIQILLLHPNTLAANQRHDDLNLAGFEFFDNMNEGFQFLSNYKNYLESHPDKNIKKLSEKIEIKLFKTSYSLIFASWDQKINFSLLQPEKNSYKETFKTLQNTELANYMINNFNAIWDTKEKVVNLKDYKKLSINIINSKNVLKDISWGHDNNNHDLPVFICVQDKTEFDKLIKSDMTVEILHDGEIKLGQIFEVKSEGNEGQNKNMYTTLFDYAKRQIEKKSGILDKDIKYIYKIKYLNRQRIELVEDDYVFKHLEARGYCYTPHNKYNVFLGTHLNKMLDTLYTFFNVDKFNDAIEIDEHKKRQYKRILVGYTCNIENEKFTILNSSEIYDTFAKKLTCKRFNRDQKDVPKEPLDIFLHKTIIANVRRIFGSSLRVTQKEKSIIKNFAINILLIQVKVDETHGVDFDDFTDEYTDFENKADYTVLHDVGKKFIKGGMPKIYIDKNDNSSPKRIYNLITPLDSVYIKNNFNNQKITMEPSNIIFDTEAFRRSTENAYGYRNIIVFEFFERNTSVS